MTKEGPKGLIKEPSEVDKYIKTKVVGDAIKLMHKHSKAERPSLDSYKSWQRILPPANAEEYDEFLTFSKAKYLFEQLLTKKGVHMTLVAFTKLAKIKAVSCRV